MTANALVTGTLFRTPEQRTSKGGKLYVTATIKNKDGETFQFWRVTAFSDTAQAELMRLTVGDALSVQGALTIDEYEKDGEKRIARKLVADHVLAVRQPREKPSPSERPAGVNRAFDDAR
jgi:single-stranded DNA-binding protein